MLRMALGGGSAILLGWACGGCTCASCFGAPRTYVVSDAQIADLTRGAPEPTPMGCQAVCNGLHLTEIGVRSDAGVIELPVESCALAGHELTCTFHECAL